MSSIKQRLARGELVLGTMISEVRNPNVAHLLALSGFDFVIIDCEHGTYSYETVSDMIAGARAANIEVIVRVPEIRKETILKPLDAGAGGLLVPQVGTPEEAREVIQLSKYAPQGNRGGAIRRPHCMYSRAGAVEVMDNANRTTFIAVQAESRLGIANADAIAATEGVDCLFCGPFDLSIDLGIPAQFEHPDEVAAIDKMLAACKKHGKAAGILLFSVAQLRPWIDKGMRFIVYSSDVNMLSDAACEAVAELRASVP
jgi:2-keto-3-deoxy-L-rhamnonate aldolase RhmA